MIVGLLLIYKACYNLFPGVFPIRPLEMSVTHEVGLVDPTKCLEKCRQLSSNVRQLTESNTVLPRDDLYFGRGSIMPT